LDVADLIDECVIVDRVVATEDLLPNYHTRSMVGLMVDQEVLQAMLEKYLPRLHQHLMNVSVPILIITLPWFLCIYTRVLSFEVLYRMQ
jgi:hypothetical protein